MRTVRQGGGCGAGAMALLCVLAVGAAAQTPMPPMPTPVPTSMPPLPTQPKRSIAGSDATPTRIPELPIPPMPPESGTEVDRVVAVVNGDLILESDVEQEQRFAALLPYGEAAGADSRDRAIERLINRDLILQQIRLQPGDEISDAAVEKDLVGLRKDVPACSRYHCETPAGWARFLATEGFTPASLAALWKQRMEVLAFIEQRFRMGIRITPAEIEAYYAGPLREQFVKQHAAEPPLIGLRERIQEVLLQQQVNKLLSDWLLSLRAQGSVVVLHPGEAAP